MPIVTDPWETRKFLDALRESRVAVPCFCTENPWTTEAVLEAARRVGQLHGISEPPVSLAFTAGYPARSNLGNYLTCGDDRLGLRALLADMEILLAPGGPYAACRVFPHLDHGQPAEDAWLLEEMAGRFAMVMFDASHYPLQENMERTADYVRRFHEQVVVEGAVDELKEAREGGGAFEMTTPEQAERYLAETGCDLIVPNVGTEHRAAEAGRARYGRHRARQIAAAVGPRLVLHGTSCMGNADLSGLPADGFVKVNVWTIIEKTGAEAVADYVVRNAGSMLERERVEDLQAEGLLGPRVTSEEYVREVCGGQIGPDLDRFPLKNLRRRWVDRVAETLVRYFEMFGYERLPKDSSLVA